MPLYGDLPLFDAEKYDRIMRDAPRHHVKKTGIKRKRNNQLTEVKCSFECGANHNGICTQETITIEPIIVAGGLEPRCSLWKLWR